MISTVAAILWLLAMQLSAVHLTEPLGQGTRNSRIQDSFGRIQAAIQLRHSANITDVLERRILYQLSGNGKQSLRFHKKPGLRLAAQLFATVTPCTGPLSANFSATWTDTDIARSIKAEIINDNLATSSKGKRDWNIMRHVSSRSATYKLTDTTNLEELILRLSKLAESAANSTPTDVRAIIGLSTRYPSIELGDAKYNLHVCTQDPVRLQSMLSVKLEPLLGAPSLFQRQFCLVVNRVRPLPEYCAAQVALGNRLPFGQYSLLKGTESLRLKDGDFVFNCVSITDADELMRSPPTVNISILRSTLSSILFVNAFLLKPPTERGAHPEATAWETVRHYQRVPTGTKKANSRAGSFLGLVDCNEKRLPIDGGRVALQEKTPFFKKRFLVQLPPGASLLLRPSRLNLLGNAFNVQIEPYSGQSETFHELAESGNLSCSDALWGYGGIVCRSSFQHYCLPGDEEACRFDRVLVNVDLGSKRKDSSALAWHTYSETEKKLVLPITVFVQAVFAKTKDQYEVVQPMIGQVDTVLQVLESIKNLTKYEMTGWNPILRREKMRAKMTAFDNCNATFYSSHFGGTTERRIRMTANKCFRRLLELTTHVYLNCYLPYNPVSIEIATINTSVYAPVYDPSLVTYLCVIFEAVIDERPRAINKWEVARTLRWLRARLMMSISTIDLPTAENQGFGDRPDYHELNTDPSGKRKIVGFEQKYIGHSPVHSPNPHFKPLFSSDTPDRILRRNRYLAIYVYARPNSQRRQGRPGPLSLIAFRVDGFDGKGRMECRDFFGIEKPTASPGIVDRVIPF